ncbi:hypothetical protein PDENDC454_19103 [Paenibacillus dendritiformis C454]|uniref:ABC transporter permease n=1 Tax=Paenibacillus dendritiformis C454 TaxID=1131935 RepID=H3SJU3_9BACL|nr:putative ABC transporter permease [Paenibacillus dendritiformis]EHQ60665.1 hypothetical protein PDENDC454_19103 [Paenibacillus dendritiformis C454]
MFHPAGELVPHSSFLYEAAAVVFFFTVYSLLGWLLENMYSLATTRIFFKDGFLWGPFKPMYGFAPLLVVSFAKPDTHWTVVLLLCFLVPTCVEYVSGWLLQTFFGRQWWDYSNLPLQLHGHICLSYSLCWVFLSYLCLRWIHPVLVAVYRAAEPYWQWLFPAAVLYFAMELLFAIRRHSPQDESAEEQQPSPAP